MPRLLQAEVREAVREELIWRDMAKTRGWLIRGQKNRAKWTASSVPRSKSSNPRSGAPVAGRSSPLPAHEPYKPEG